MTDEGFQRFHQSELARIATDPASTLIYCEEIPALAVLRPLPWDSGLLQMSLGSFDYLLFPELPEDALRRELLDAFLDHVTCHARELGWQLLLHKSCTADASSTGALTRNRFELLTIHLEFLFEISRLPSLDPNFDGQGYEWKEYQIGPARADEEEALGELSANYHAAFDRFRIDPLLPAARVPEIYREWARNSVRGYADLVWVARREGEPVGFGTWARRSRLEDATGICCAEYQLGAVASSERNRGLFRTLTHGALHGLGELGQQWGSGATNALNTPTQRCFQRLGAWVHSPIVTYRKDLHG